MYVEKTTENDLPSISKSLDDLKKAWNNCIGSEKKFKDLLKQFKI